MPEVRVRGHLRRNGFLRRSTWVRPHYRRRPLQNWWIAPAVVTAVILLVLWLILEH